MITAITALFVAIGKGLDTANSYKERQSETDVLKDKKKKAKAIEYAEKIIFLADKTELADSKEYKRLRKLFFKNN